MILKHTVQGEGNINSANAIKMNYSETVGAVEGWKGEDVRKVETNRAT